MAETKASPIENAEAHLHTSQVKKLWLGFRRVILRGLGFMMPPLLTMLLLVWGWQAIDQYVLSPFEFSFRSVLVWSIDDSLDATEAQRLVAQGDARRRAPATAESPEQLIASDGRQWLAVGDEWVAGNVYRYVQSLKKRPPMETARQYYDAFVTQRTIYRAVEIPLFFFCFFGLLYLLGRFFGAGIGRAIWRGVENLIKRIPVVSNIYSSVQQVSEFALKDQRQKFSNVVAVEYPRPGMWSLAFVTGGGVDEVESIVGEPITNIFIPTSPMPASGFTLAIAKSQVREVDVTLEQALQYFVSCGVVTPNGNRDANNAS